MSGLVESVGADLSKATNGHGAREQKQELNLNLGAEGCVDVYSIVNQMDSSKPEASDQLLELYIEAMKPAAALLIDPGMVTAAQWSKACDDFYHWAESVIPIRALEQEGGNLMFGPSMMITSFVLGTYGQLLVQLGRYSQAREWMDMAVDVAERRLMKPLKDELSQANQWRLEEWYDLSKTQQTVSRRYPGKISDTADRSFRFFMRSLAGRRSR